MSGCSGNCAACPALRERAPGHLAEHALPEDAPGPHRGASLVGRSLLAFGLPLLLALAGALRFGTAGGLGGLIGGMLLAVALLHRSESRCAESAR